MRLPGVEPGAQAWEAGLYVAATLQALLLNRKKEACYSTHSHIMSYCLLYDASNYTHFCKKRNDVMACSNLATRDESPH